MTLDPDFFPSFDAYDSPIVNHYFHRAIADGADGIQHRRRNLPIDGMGGLPFTSLHVESLR
jgi:hypothetical protein